MVLLKTGDLQAAADAAYPSAKDTSRHSLRYQTIRSQAVADVLEIWKWRDTDPARAKLIQIVEAQLAVAEVGSTAAAKFTVQLERLTVGLKGTNAAHFVDPLAPEPEDETPKAVTQAPRSVPDGCTPLVDKGGVVRGYKTPDGRYVQLPEMVTTMVTTSTPEGAEIL